MDGKKILDTCLKCKAQCCGLGGADYTNAEYERVIKAGHPDHFVKLGEDHFETKVVKGVCPYLKDCACTIYNERPAICRTWPVDVFTRYKDGARIYYLRDCPLSKHLGEKDIKELVKHSEGMKKHILHNSLRKSKISKKDLALISKRMDGFKKKRFGESKEIVATQK